MGLPGRQLPLLGRRGAHVSCEAPVDQSKWRTGTERRRVQPERRVGRRKEVASSQKLVGAAEDLWLRTWR